MDDHVFRAFNVKWIHHYSSLSSAKIDNSSNGALAIISAMLMIGITSSSAFASTRSSINVGRATGIIWLGSPNHYNILCRIINIVSEA